MIDLVVAKRVEQVDRAFSVIRQTDLKDRLFSTCLFQEPEYARLFPARDVSRRFLQRDDVSYACEKNKASLCIFCDEANVEHALSFREANVYLVAKRQEEPAFAQHLWRYYSTLLPGAHKRFHHFRGLDNVAAEDISLTECFELSRADLLHAPYHAFKQVEGKEYIPVRGSCSVARKGVAELADWLSTKRVEPVLAVGSKKSFHLDEFFLRGFFYARLGKINLFTLVDRLLPPAAWEDLQTAIKRGATVSLHAAIGKGLHMRSAA